MDKDFKKLEMQRNKPIDNNIIKQNIIDKYSITSNKLIVNNQRDLLINNINIDLNKKYDNFINQRDIENKNIYEGLFNTGFDKKIETIKIVKNIKTNITNPKEINIAQRENKLENIFIEQKKKTQDLLNKLNF